MAVSGLVTEKEAVGFNKKLGKRCCGSEETGDPRKTEVDGHTKFLRFCVGSACMGWRWAPGQGDVKEPLGYCGIAGAPWREFRAPEASAALDLEDREE